MCVARTRIGLANSSPIGFQLVFGERTAQLVSNTCEFNGWRTATFRIVFERRHVEPFDAIDRFAGRVQEPVIF
jgi:hypothetical protein